MMRELIVNNYPKSSITESIKSIKTNLRFSSINQKIKTILVTSSIAGEGKSFISANLATSFATTSEKVLLIDCDLRRGRQKEVFDLKDNIARGLSNLLIDPNWQDNLQDYIQNTAIDNLDMIPAGITPPNPSTLLESKKLEKIMEELKNKYDIIILDTPPVIGISDALILTRLSDAVLIIARAKKTTIELLENTKEALQNVNANIAGVILNRINRKSNKYYKDYYLKK